MKSIGDLKISRFILVTGLVVLFILVMITPVSAELRTINKGATIFIGESNLDITNAVGSSTKIGWWASGSTSTNPDFVMDISSKYKSFTVDQDTFVSRTGNWYALTETNNKQDVVFNVKDPQLSVAAWDFVQQKDVTGLNVVHGGHLGVKITTNMYAATNPQYRPNANAATDGYIKIKVKDESGAQLSNLLMGTSGSTTSTSTLNQYVSTQPWIFGTSTSYWVTDATDAQGQYVYPAGTYIFWAESALNNMKQNYKNTGADYTGKTVSATGTVTLISDTVTIEANKDFVVRGTGQGFSLTVFAAALSKVDVYINNGEVSGITPPTLSPDSYSTLISPGHIQTQTSTSGTRTVSFVLSQQTTPQVYTLKVVGSTPNHPTDQTNVEVLLVAPTPTPTPTQSIGSIVVQSNPTGATIFLDNAIKGITPLTLTSVPNGNHVVLLRLHGYQDSTNTVILAGDTQTVNPTLTPSNAPTTGVTTVATTGAVTSAPTTGIITTQFTTPATTATPRPTAKVNYSATIAVMQSQIAEQNAKIEEQESWIDQILRFLGLK